MKNPKVMLLTIVTLILQFNAMPSCGLRILAVFPSSVKSHFVVLERLMRGLAERGHQVDVYSQFPLKTPPPNYNDYSLTSDGHQTMNNISYEVIKPFYESFVQNLIKSARPLNDILGTPVLRKLIHNPPRYDVFITAPFASNCYLAFGRHLNIPMVNVVPTPSLLDWMYEPLGSPTNLASDPSIMLHFTNPMTFFERLENVIRSKFTTYAFNYYVREQDEIVEKYFRPGFPDVVELQKDISLVLLNYSPSLNGIRTYSPNVIPIGGLHIVDSQDDLPKHIQEFLDEANDGFVYVSFGSMIRIETYPTRTLEAFYETFKKIAPIRVLMKIAKPNELPPGLPSNVITNHWLPQVKVLKHKNIKAFITHGGLMGTLESIYHGVPMVGIPMGMDQHYNMETYVRKNLAVKLEESKITKESFTTAIKEILTNPIYKKSAEKAGDKMRDVPMDPMDTAAFWIEYIARHGKNALRPPVIDLPWWQASLLDVYAFILLLVLTVLYIIKLVLKKIIFICLSKETAAFNTKIKTN